MADHNILNSNPSTYDPLPLDPYAFWPGVQGPIAGLGGSAAPVDPDNVFHTAYCTFAPARMRFNVRFSELKGQGQLVLRVNALRSLPNATATTIATRAHMLADEQDLTLSLDVECETGLTYAILANLMDGEGTAAGLDVTVEAVDTPRDVTGYARATFLAEAAPAALANHVTWGPATLETPVSQMCTARQFREPVYREWTHALNTEPTLHRKQWEFIYILQALRQAGALIPGARGIGFGVGREPLPALFASMGCSVVATDLAADDDRAHDWRETQQHIDSIEALRRPDLCPDLLFDRTVSFHAADMTRIPANLRDFDFTWSSCAFEHLGSIAAGLAFVEASLDCLKPGGVAVHTSEFNLSSNDDTIDDAGTVLFRRRDIETLAIRLLRAGHDVAPLCYDIGTEPIDAHIDVAPYADVPHLKLALAGYVTTSFGLIVRKRTKRRWFGRQGGV